MNKSKRKEKKQVSQKKRKKEKKEGRKGGRKDRLLRRPSLFCFCFSCSLSLFSFPFVCCAIFLSSPCGRCPGASRGEPLVAPARAPSPVPGSAARCRGSRRRSPFDFYRGPREGRLAKNQVFGFFICGLKTLTEKMMDEDVGSLRPCPAPALLSVSLGLESVTWPWSWALLCLSNWSLSVERAFEARKQTGSAVLPAPWSS
jgi:hypothetical protein